MNKIALITGATGGIGKAISLSLANQGYNIILTARNKQKLEHLAEYIHNNYMVECSYFVQDLCTETSLCTLELLIERYQRIDVIVNCAGIFLNDSVEENIKNSSKLFLTNVISAQKICDTCIPYMKKQKEGYIFNIASIAGVRGYKNITNYCTSKHALVGYSLSLAKTLKSHGIKVTVICPDVVDTSMSQSSSLTKSEKIKPKDIAKTISYLLSLSSVVSIEQLTMGRI